MFAKELTHFARETQQRDKDAARVGLNRSGIGLLVSLIGEALVFIEFYDTRLLSLGATVILSSKPYLVFGQPSCYISDILS